MEHGSVSLFAVYDNGNPKGGRGTANVTDKLSVGLPIGTKPTIQLAIGDPDTGLNQEGDGQLALYTDNQERLRITAEGKVGIGVKNPIIQLALGDNDTGLQQEGDGNLALYTDNQERMRITPIGHVGIGTKNPHFPLSITGDSLGNKLAIWSHSKDHWMGFGASSGQMNYRVSAQQSHVFYGSTDNSKELLRLNPDTITLNTKLKYTGNKPLIKVKTVSARNNGDTAQYTDTGISHTEYPKAS